MLIGLAASNSFIIFLKQQKIYSQEDVTVLCFEPVFLMVQHQSAGIFVYEVYTYSKSVISHNGAIRSMES